MISRIPALWRLIVGHGIVATYCSSFSAWAEPIEQKAIPQKPAEIHINPEPTRNSGPVSNTLSPWGLGSIVNILADQSPLEDILQEFGNQMNLRVFCSPGVRGRVSGRFLGLTPEKFLDQLSRAYGLDWLYYNQQIYFYSSAESQTVVRTLRYLPVEQAVKVVEQMGIFSVGASIRGIPETPMVLLSGPPKFLEIAQEVIRTLEEQTAYKQTNEMVIQVFPLNYAWAYDVQLSGGTGIEGIATTLSRLVHGYGGGGGGGFSVSLGNFTPNANLMTSVTDRAGTQQQVARAFPPNRETPQNSISSQQSSPASSGKGNQQNGGMGDGYGPASATANQYNVSIAADVRANAVVVRDIRENMPFYKAAIAKLDVPVRIVEISAAIVDIDVNASRSLGFSGININASGLQMGTNTTGGAIGGNFSISGVYGTNTITAALNFLEKNQQAKVLSRPTIVTLDNFAASIGTQDTFYAKTGDRYSSNLYDVSAGLTLQVVPHITIERGQAQIYMQVKVEDGDVNSDTPVNGLPTVRQSHLITQSIVRKDQSLLIGGLYRKVDAKDRSGYPWLNKVPGLNFLFSSSRRQKMVVERLFLITPRVVDIYSKSLGDYSQYFRPSPGVEEAEQKSRNAQIPTPSSVPGRIPERSRR